MRCLTLTQPWCGLVASGLKLVENMDRPIIKRADFGQPFGLHASREIVEDYYDVIYSTAPELVAPEFEGEASADLHQWIRLARITSAVIAVARIERAVALQQDGIVRDLHTGERVDLGDQRRWLTGPIGYVLAESPVVIQPVPMRGWQGFWSLYGNVAKVVAQRAGV